MLEKICGKCWKAFDTKFEKQEYCRECELNEKLGRRYWKERLNELLDYFKLERIS